MPVCNYVQREHCHVGTYTVCKTVPYTVMKTVPYTTCKVIPEEHCRYVTCKKCTSTERVDTETLQHLVDRLAATCFSCTSGKLKSMARSFGNILQCQNRECGRNNYWQGLGERIRR